MIGTVTPSEGTLVTFSLYTEPLGAKSWKVLMPQRLTMLWATRTNMTADAVHSSPCFPRPLPPRAPPARETTMQKLQCRTK